MCLYHRNIRGVLVWVLQRNRTNSRDRYHFRCWEDLKICSGKPKRANGVSYSPSLSPKVQKTDVPVQGKSGRVNTLLLSIFVVVLFMPPID